MANGICCVAIAPRLQRISDRLGEPRKATRCVVEPCPDHARATDRRERTERSKPNGEIDMIPDGRCDRRRHFSDALFFHAPQECHRQVTVLRRDPSRIGDRPLEQPDRAAELIFHRLRQRQRDEQPDYVASNRYNRTRFKPPETARVRTVFRSPGRRTSRATSIAKSRSCLSSPSSGSFSIPLLAPAHEFVAHFFQ